MAERRMFAKTIVLSDAFLDMPLSTRCLYFTLGMLADDDGFVGSPKSIMRQCGATQDDMLLLLSKRFVLGFDSGVIVIKHWKLNNYLRNDRYTPTTYKEELAALMLDQKGSYTEADGKRYPDGIPVGIPTVSTGKDSIGKVSIGKDSIGKTTSSSSWKAEVAQVVEAWNSLGLSQVKKIVPGSDRDKQLKKRISDYGIDEVLRAIENVRESEFLKGGGEKGWTIQFDWFISPNNFAKVLEGNYAKSREKKNELDQKLDAIRRWADEHE